VQEALPICSIVPYNVARILYINVITVDILCYDDGCHLCKYSRNPIRANITEAATRISTWNIVIDKTHFSGHPDPWCNENCNPNKVKDLDEVCEDHNVNP